MSSSETPLSSAVDQVGARERCLRFALSMQLDLTVGRRRSDNKKTRVVAVLAVASRVAALLTH